MVRDALIVIDFLRDEGDALGRESHGGCDVHRTAREPLDIIDTEVGKIAGTDERKFLARRGALLPQGRSEILELLEVAGASVEPERHADGRAAGRDERLLAGAEHDIAFDVYLRGIRERRAAADDRFLAGCGAFEAPARDIQRAADGAKP